MRGLVLRRSDVLRGREALAAVAAPYDALVRRTGGPLTARSPWLQAWAGAHPGYEPWTLVVREDGSDRLVAAAALGRREVAGRLDVAPLGFGRNDRARLPAVDGEAAGLLADLLVGELGALDVPWTLRVEQLPVDDPVAAALAARLPFSAVLPGGDVPHVRMLPEVETPEAHLTKNMRTSLRKAANRLASDGHRLELARTSTPDGVLAQLDEVAVVHRDRDRAQGRQSDLDSDEGASFWRDVLETHAARGEVELTTLRAEGALVAYVLAFLDGNAYRVFDGRFSSEWARYSPGRSVEVSALGRAMADPRFTVLDWMNSVAPDKLVAANGVEPTQHLVACSASLAKVPLQAVVDGLSVARDHAPSADPALRVLAGAGRDLPRRPSAVD